MIHARISFFVSKLLPLCFLVTLVSCDSSGLGGGDGISVGDGGGGFEIGSGSVPAPSDTPPPTFPPFGGEGGSGGGTGGGGGGAGGGGGGGGGGGCTPAGSGGTETVLWDFDTGNFDSFERVQESFDGEADSCNDLSITLRAVDRNPDAVDTTSFQVVIVTDDSEVLLRTVSLFAPDGDEVVETPTDASTAATTLAVSANNEVNSLTYPARGADPNLTEGDYIQNVTFSEAGAAASFQGNVVAKRDPDLNGGTLRINFFLVGSEVQTGSERTAIDTARVLLRAIYAQAGLSLSESVFEVTSDSGVVPYPVTGSTFYFTEITRAGVPQYSLNVFIGSEISRNSDTSNGAEILDGVVGVAAGIPGPSIPTSKSAVAVSLLAHDANGDGSYNDAETQLLGETLAHEGGHYLGLFHPVEIAGIDSNGDFVFTYQDPLADTPVCSFEAECLDNGTALLNMFPTPLISGTELVDQTVLTSGQSRVMNLQVIVD